MGCCSCMVLVVVCICVALTGFVRLQMASVIFFGLAILMVVLGLVVISRLSLLVVCRGVVSGFRGWLTQNQLAGGVLLQFQTDALIRLCLVVKEATRI